MKWRKIYVLIFICSLGGIFTANAVTRHNHVDKHYHVHERKSIFQEVRRNHSIPSDLNKVEGKRAKKHQHDSDVSYVKHTNRLPSNTIIRSEEDLHNKGYFKLRKRLRFKFKAQQIVRQHAARSIDLDCKVKGITSRKNLSVEWLKDEISIHDYFKR